jgi:predicted DNA-binding protein
MRKQTNFDKMTWLILSLYVLLFICSFACSCEEKQEATGHNVEGIAKEACQEVGVVERSSHGTQGAPIIILEENHASRAGQIQNAITLVRLYERYGLKHIALEGYLKERPEIKTDWFTKAAQGLSSTDRNRIVVRLLREGEISCAEFMRLVYDDIFLHPIETISEYAVDLNEEASRAPTLYLLKIAQQSLREEHVAKLKQFQEDIEQLKGEANKEAFEKKIKEMFDYILAADPWAQDKTRLLQDKNVIRSMSGEQHMALIEEIVNRAERLSVELEPEEKNAMEQYLRFWRGRVKASKTMILCAERIADQANVSVVAMVIGAAHTQGMCAMLKDSKRPFAVVTPISLKGDNEAGDLTWDMLQRKYKKVSIYSEGFTQAVLEALLEHKKPELVLSEPWFEGKVELYLFTERIASGVLGPSNPPAGGKPPYGFSNDDFKGKWVFVDPNRITIISDTKDGKGRAVLFPVILNYTNPERRIEIWSKAGLGIAMVPGQERESVESMLKKTLEEVQKEIEPGTKVEDNAGRIQITLNTIAGYTRTQEAAKKVTLGCI